MASDHSLPRRHPEIQVSARSCADAEASTAAARGDPFPLGGSAGRPRTARVGAARLSVGHGELVRCAASRVPEPQRTGRHHGGLLGGRAPVGPDRRLSVRNVGRWEATGKPHPPGRARCSIAKRGCNSTSATWGRDLPKSSPLRRDRSTTGGLLRRCDGRRPSMESRARQCALIPYLRIRRHSVVRLTPSSRAA